MRKFRPARVLAATTASLLVAGLALSAPADAAAAKKTTTTLSAGKSVAGSKTKLTATVRPRTKTGTVRFSVSGKTLAKCGKVRLRSGKASCSAVFTHTGTRTVKARYSGKAHKYRASSATKRVTSTARSTAPKIVGGTGTCTTSKGAIVGVSFATWSGPLARGCGVSSTTGRKLLTDAGFTLTDVSKFPTFICRIGSPNFDSGTQYPKPAQDRCVNTPPASAYWSFWTAKKGVNTWTYSAKGASSHTPSNGEVEAWTFGATNASGTSGKPTFTPNQLRSGLPSTTAAAKRNTQLRALAAPGSDADLSSGTGYLVDQLTNGDHYEVDDPINGGTRADIGLTVDGAYALAAAGSRDATLRNITDYVAAHTGEYTYLSVDPQYADGGSIAKIALLAEMAGRDPRDFGGFNLIKELRDRECTKADAATQCEGKGGFVYTSSTFGQTLAVLALQRAGVTDTAAIAFLETLQTKDGGFASSTSGGSYIETDSTAIAAMALALVKGDKARGALASALKWLAAQQNSDGGFPGAAGNSTNSAALSIQALSLDANSYSAQIAKGQRFLASVQNNDGGFDIAAGQDGSDVRASAQAVGGVVGTPFGSVLDDLGSKADADDGADYLESQLVGGDHYTGTYDPDQDPTTDNNVTFDDQGLTADGVFALLGTGGHAAAVTRMTDYLKGQVDNYADPNGDQGFGPSSGAIAKLALIAMSTGNDPNDFGNTDLLTVLKDNVCTAASSTPFGPCTAKGDFANSYSEISQALGVLALQASPNAADHLTSSSSPVVRLKQLQCADGGFSSSLVTAGATCNSEVDATGFAVQALLTVPGNDNVLGKALSYLESKQRSSGLFPGAAGDNSNSTALGAIALQSLVQSLHSNTPDRTNVKAIAPVVPWQSALTGLRTLAVNGGGYGITTNTVADLRSSTQAVLAASQHTLIGLVGADIASTPRVVCTCGGGSAGGGSTGGDTGGSSNPGNGGTTSSGSASGSGGNGAAPRDDSASPVANPADTGVTAGAQLIWAALLLLLGTALTLAGRRRGVLGRHRQGAHTE